MSQADNTRNGILQLLADGQFHSGEKMGELFNISRAAISKHIKVLNSLGLDIFSVTGKGYKLATALTLLDKQTISAEIPTDMPLEVLPVIPSTNDYLKSRIGSLQKGHSCLAEAQTAGRGRQGKTWVSPYGASLYLSLYWSFDGGYQSVTGLSLAIGVAIAKALEKAGIKQPQLKWPNDIYVQGQKLAGVLVELEGQMDAQCHCIIGIGLNVHLPENTKGIDQPWTDVATHLAHNPDRNELAALLLTELKMTLQTFETEGFSAFLPDWQPRDYFKDKPVSLLMGQSEVKGIVRGVNESGALMLENAQGLKAYYGGEISVRAS